MRDGVTEDRVPAYTASLLNTEGDAFLFYTCLPHPPAPVPHKHRGLAPATIRTLQRQQQARRGGTGSQGFKNSRTLFCPDQPQNVPKLSPDLTAPYFLHRNIKCLNKVFKNYQNQN